LAFGTCTHLRSTCFFQKQNETAVPREREREFRFGLAETLRVLFGTFFWHLTRAHICVSRISAKSKTKLLFRNFSVVCFDFVGNYPQIP